MPNADSNGKITLLYACSGVANTGLLADQVARRLHADGTGKMTCLAAMGAETAKFITEANEASRKIVIDGCPISCGAAIFKQLDIPCEHFRTTDFGIEKGKTPITDEVITDVTSQVKESIRNGK
jgi:uncharacterized metal-binding protein